MAYGGGYFGSTYYGGTSGGKVTVVKSLTASVAAKGTLTKSLTASVAAAVAVTLTITASVAAQAQFTRQLTASVAAQAQYTRTVTASVAAQAQVVKSLTASVRAVAEPTLYVTASVVGYLIKADYETISVGALRLDLFSSGGTALGGLFTARGINVRFALDQIGSLSFSVPATDPMTANLVGGVHVKAYHKTNGYIGEYILRKPTKSVSQTEIRYEGWSLMQELVFANTYLRRQYNNIAVSTVLSVANVSGNLYGLLYGTGWTPGTIDGSLGNITVAYEGQSIFEAIAAIGSRMKLHFREGATARTLDFGAMGVDSGKRLVMPQLMTSDLNANTLAGIAESIEEVTDTDEIWNTIVPLGGGQGLGALTLQTSTRTTPYTIQTGTNPDSSSYWYLADAASVATNGTRVKVLPFTDINPLSNSDADIINGANALYDKASAYLQWYKDAHLIYNVTARQVAWSVKCGDKIRLEYRGVVTQRGAAFKWADINDLFYVMERTDTFDASGSAQTVLLLSNLGRRQIDDAAIVIGALQAVKVMQTFVQPYPSAETFVYREELAPSHTVTLPVEIDSRVLYLNSCKVRLQTRPLRSTITATSVAAGGGQTSSSGGGQTSSSSGGQTPTSSSGGGQTTSTGGNHYHTFTISNGTGSDPVTANPGSPGTLYWGSGASGFKSTGYDVGSGHSHTVSDHTHTVSISAHTHTVADHTHTVSDHSHGTTITYGIYDDTAYPTTISLAIDGIDRTTALGGTWQNAGGAANVVLDVTTYIVNAAGGLRQAHTLVFSCTGGQGTVVATVRSLMTTQLITVA
ncbi:MAG: hypothetical protein V1899_03005 [Planctomycetota bacterium]